MIENKMSIEIMPNESPKVVIQPPSPKRKHMNKNCKHLQISYLDNKLRQARDFNEVSDPVKIPYAELLEHEK